MIQSELDKAQKEKLVNINLKQEVKYKSEIEQLNNYKNSGEDKFDELNIISLFEKNKTPFTFILFIVYILIGTTCF